MAAERSGKVEQWLHACRYAGPLERRSVIRGRDDLPRLRGTNRLYPQPNASLFPGMDLLTFPYECDEHKGFVRGSIGDAHEKLRFGTDQLPFVL
jgi:hypothetical protein